MDLIIRKAELIDNDLNDNTFRVYFDAELYRFYAVENVKLNQKARVLTYKPIDSIDKIVLNHRDEILRYCLSEYSDEDNVTIADIFLHGGFIQKM